MAGVTLSGVTKEYDNGFQAVKDLDLDIEDGEFLVMVGPSGCGKSTTLRMIAGLEDISGGELRIGDRVVNDVHPKDRDIAMVFQNYALYPHMTVADNIGFALKLAGRAKSEIKERVGEAARLLELTDQLDKKPGELSGGQRQRVAMGRAIVRRPQVFLLDEPLSNLDAKLRVQMRAEITELQRNVGVTTFYVTHDQVEAMTMADRVAVINAGVLQQVAAPQTLYDEPDNLFVAAFIGSPSMNLMEGTISQSGGKYTLQLGSNTLDLPDAAVSSRPALAGYVDKTVVVGIRPEDFEDAAVDTGRPATQRISVQVENVEALGFEKIVHFDIDAKQVIQADALDLDEDAEVVHHGDGARISGRFAPSTRARVGEMLEVAVYTEDAHFFDLDSGLAIRD
jgi:multiple sugar transport system ATP-binding protein